MILAAVVLAAHLVHRVSATSLSEQVTCGDRQMPWARFGQQSALPAGPYGPLVAEEAGRSVGDPTGNVALLGMLQTADLDVGLRFGPAAACDIPVRPFQCIDLLVTRLQDGKVLGGRQNVRTPSRAAVALASSIHCAEHRP